MADFKAAWERGKKTAPVRTRVCAVIVEDSRRTVVSNDLATNQTNKFPFMQIFDC